ncbi:ATP-dependent Clp protease ATP-binding subunit ClpC1 [Streptomyces sp. YIM 130001]|uniref:Clp protease N-terminal domain-containing protein n=1 Tax=Streptomyces sp. YIM 130001 TaxID=2259644 RepID=UPI000E65A7CB|nr:Clp protease N-terminal domain-containing protein [Streptomyces sp. YIM 130001]RII16017.1 ATP-dependent Clp protease ATP-binding subunit ClpC1 [Streptomyces sp. YIM 130001]
MFERFTQGARAVVEGAVAYAESREAPAVTDEHLVLALLDAEGTKGSFVLHALGMERQRDTVERELAEARRRGGVSDADARALAGLGVDVDAIVARAEEEHGEGALAGTARRARRRLTGHRPFTPEAKDVLEKSLRAALGRGDRSIGDEHLLLALTARPGVPRDVLAGHGLSHDAVVRVLG